VRYLLSQAGADRVVIHTRFYPDPAAVVALVRDSLGAPGYQDELVAVFAVPRVDDPPDGLEPVIAWAADAWSEAIPLGDGEGRFMGAAGTLYLYADAPVYRDVVIPVQSYRTPRRIAVWLDDHLINAQWIGAGAMRLVLQLDPGYHALRFQALDGCTPYPFALSCWDSPDSALDCPPIDPPLCISTALGAPAWIVPDTPLAAVDARLDHGLRLRAYSAAPLADAVEVRLFWEAARPLPEDYALFVHLADPATGEPLAQYDGFPLVMTGDWEAGTRWQSVVQVPLPDDLPAGTYALNVGWFDPKTGARLAVKGEGPWEADGILTLRSIELDPGH
jgi:hypothetical protein